MDDFARFCTKAKQNLKAKAEENSTESGQQAILNN